MGGEMTTYWVESKANRFPRPRLTSRQLWQLSQQRRTRTLVLVQRARLLQLPRLRLNMKKEFIVWKLDLSSLSDIDTYLSIYLSRVDENTHRKSIYSGYLDHTFVISQ